MTALAASECGPAVESWQCGFEEMCPARYATVRTTGGGKSSRCLARIMHTLDPHESRTETSPIRGQVVAQCGLIGRHRLCA
jgi:hypothetical protein